MKNTLRPDPTLKDYWRNNSRFSDFYVNLYIKIFTLRNSLC